MACNNKSVVDVFQSQQQVSRKIAEKENEALKDEIRKLQVE